MKNTHKVRTLAATLITIGSLSGGANAGTIFGDFSSSTAFADDYSFVSIFAFPTNTFSTASGNAILQAGGGTAGYVWNQGDVLDEVGDSITADFTYSSLSLGGFGNSDVAVGFGLWNDIIGSTLLSEPRFFTNGFTASLLQGQAGTNLGGVLVSASFTQTVSVVGVQAGTGNLILNHSISGDYGSPTSQSITVNDDEIFFGFTAFNTGNTYQVNEASFTNASAVPAPAAIWLIGSGLIGLLGMRKKASNLSEKHA